MTLYSCVVPVYEYCNPENRRESFGIDRDIRGFVEEKVHIGECKYHCQVENACEAEAHIGEPRFRLQ